MILKNREKLIICALFLSKFDCLAYQKLGFSSFIEAFNVLGYALGGKPSSIKNYRDEFDPYFDNERKGWHKRQMREYCSNIYEKYKDMEFIDFYELICSFINPIFSFKKRFLIWLILRIKVRKDSLQVLPQSNFSWILIEIFL